MNAARIERELICGLTDEQVQSRGRLLGETVTQIDETNDARSAAMKEFKDRLTGLVEQQRKLARVIRDRAEKRMVVCLVKFHVPQEGMKRIVRMDTAEVIAEEPMTEGERQMHLFATQQDLETLFGKAETPPADPEDLDLPPDKQSTD